MAISTMGGAMPHTRAQTGSAEHLEPSRTYETYFEKEDIAALSTEHREYLLKRHGTLDLDFIPAFGDADPYNWSTVKVLLKW